MNERDWEKRERLLDEIVQGKRLPTRDELRELATKEPTRYEIYLRNRLGKERKGTK